METGLVKQMSNMMDAKLQDLRADLKGDVSELKKICLKSDKKISEMSQDIKVLQKSDAVQYQMIADVQLKIHTLNDKFDKNQRHYDVLEEEFDAMKKFVPKINTRVKKLEKAI